MHGGRYTARTDDAPAGAAGGRLHAAIGPSAPFGANGMKIGPDGRLYVAQAFGSQVDALDFETAAAEAVVPVGSAIVALDDFAFDTRGMMYITELMSERVSARLRDGTLRVVASDVPVANGIAGVIPGPLLPFADLAVAPDGRVLIGADGAGAVLALARGTD